MKKKAVLLWGDAVIFAILLLTVLFSVLLPFLSDGKKQPLTLSVKSEKGLQRYPLSQDAEIPLESNGHHLTLHIKGGQAWVTNADCPDHFCEKTGVISSAGQTIICLPAETVITMEGGDTDADIILG